MRAAICVRVSPRPADKVKYSPEIQEGKCREWCAENGHEVVTVVSDIMVSGGAANRFDSVFAALDAHDIDLFVVSDLSRWTRDDPERFWYIRHVLKERGVLLRSVDEPWLGSEMPFEATISTATVEMNANERKRTNAKTSAGIRAAIASGKVWGPARYGWSRDADGKWQFDTPKVVSLYQDWISGMPAKRIGEKHGMRTGHVRRAVHAPSQRRVVGDELWLAAQQREPGRTVRGDAKTGNVFRGLLTCPFCGCILKRTSWKQPYRFYCVNAPLNLIEHTWRTLDLRTVIPVVQSAIERLQVPEDEIELLASRDEITTEPARKDYGKEIERLTMAWVKGRVSDDRYEKAVAALEAERDKPVPLPVPVPYQVEIARFAEQADLWTDDIEEARLLNDVLREAFIFTVGVKKEVSVKIAEPYASWAK